MCGIKGIQTTPNSNVELNENVNEVESARNEALGEVKKGSAFSLAGRVRLETAAPTSDVDLRSNVNTVQVKTLKIYTSETIHEGLTEIVRDHLRRDDLNVNPDRLETFLSQYDFTDLRGHFDEQTRTEDSLAQPKRLQNELRNRAAESMCVQFEAVERTDLAPNSKTEVLRHISETPDSPLRHGQVLGMLISGVQKTVEEHPVSEINWSVNVNDGHAIINREGTEGDDLTTSPLKDERTASFVKYARNFATDIKRVLNDYPSKDSLAVIDFVAKNIVASGATGTELTLEELSDIQRNLKSMDPQELGENAEIVLKLADRIVENEKETRL